MYLKVSPQTYRERQPFLLLINNKNGPSSLGWARSSIFWGFSYVIAKSESSFISNE